MGQSFDANIQETPKNGKFLHVLRIQISSDAAEFEPGLPRKAAILVLITAQSYIGATIQRGSSEESVNGKRCIPSASYAERPIRGGCSCTSACPHDLRIRQLY